jgi:hypothetical protein
MFVKRITRAAVTALLCVATLSLTAPAHAAETVSGIRLIELAHEQNDLQYQLGHGGRVVCELANVPEGAPEECLQGGKPFWGYWRGDGRGGWTWSGTGAAETEVEDGDVEGWAWGEGFDGSSHPKPSGDDGVTFESICARESEAPQAALVVDTQSNVYKMCIDLPVDSAGTGPADDGEDDDPKDPSDSETPAEDGESTPSPERSDDEDKTDGRAPKAGNRTSEEKPLGEGRLDSAPAPSELEGPLVALASPEPSLPAGATSAEADPQEFPASGILAIVATLAMAGVAAYLLTRRKST